MSEAAKRILGLVGVAGIALLGIYGVRQDTADELNPYANPNDTPITVSDGSVHLRGSRFCSSKRRTSATAIRYRWGPTFQAGRILLSMNL